LESGFASAVKTLSMPCKIVVRDGEPIAAALRRLKRHAENNGIYYEMRRRKNFVRATEIRRRKEERKRIAQAKQLRQEIWEGRRPVR
jgi:ribosomal protein S21